MRLSFLHSARSEQARQLANKAKMSGERLSRAEEKKVLMDPWASYIYAHSVIKDRWPEAERFILKDPWIAHLYALYVIKGRWPQAEYVIKKDYQAYYRYLENVMGDRLQRPSMWMESGIMLSFDQQLEESIGRVLGEYRIVGGLEDNDGDPLVFIKSIHEFIDGLEIGRIADTRFDEFVDHILSISNTTPWRKGVTSELYEDIELIDDPNEAKSMFSRIYSILKSVWDALKKIIIKAPGIALKAAKAILKLVSMIIAGTARIASPIARLLKYLAQFTIRTEKDWQEIIGKIDPTYAKLMARKSAGKDYDKRELAQLERELAHGTAISRIMNPAIAGMAAFASPVAALVVPAADALSEVVLLVDKIASDKGIMRTNIDDILGAIIGGLVSGINTLIQSMLGVVRGILNFAADLMSFWGLGIPDMIIDAARKHMLEPISDLFDAMSSRLREVIVDFELEEDLAKLEETEGDIEVIRSELAAVA